MEVENSLLECGHFYVLSRFFVFWWDIAGLPNTQLIIPLIIHNVGDYSDKNIQFPQCTHPGTTPLSLPYSFSPTHLTYLTLIPRKTANDFFCRSNNLKSIFLPRSRKFPILEEIPEIQFVQPLLDRVDIIGHSCWSSKLNLFARKIDVMISFRGVKLWSAVPFSQK